MSAAFYRQGPSGKVATSHNVVVAGKGEGAEFLTLTCRWPEGTQPKAYVVFCHGLGASGSDYAGLSEFWAAHGYLVIHPTFPDWIRTVAEAEPDLGLDPAADDLAQWPANPKVRARMLEILHTPEWWMKRLLILGQVMDGMDGIIAATAGGNGAPLPGAIAGHSFGAYIAQLAAGAEVDIPGRGPCQFRDKRLAAAVLLSAQGRDQQGLREGSWDKLTGPVLTVTGTLDHGAKNQDWNWKSEPFHLSPDGGKYLAVLDNADHYLGGFATVPTPKDVPSQREAVNQLTLAFLDAWVSGDESAQAWLDEISDQIGDCPILFDRK